MSDKVDLEPENDEQTAELKAMWSQVCASKAVKAEIRDAWFKKISNLYSEPTRHYHTLKHIHEIGRWIEKFETELEDLAAVRYATWFHDIIYDATKNDNEEQSEVLWRQFSTESELDATFSDKVSMFIIATKTHKPPNDVSDDDLNYFLDFDTAILAAPEEAYDLYARQIRKEYIHVPLDLYQKGRAAVLKNFLNHDPFVTEVFNSIYGPKAKENLEREIAWLPNLTE